MNVYFALYITNIYHGSLLSHDTLPILPEYQLVTDSPPMPAYLNYTHKATHGSTLQDATNVSSYYAKFMHVYWGFVLLYVLSCVV